MTKLNNLKNKLKTSKLVTTKTSTKVEDTYFDFKLKKYMSNYDESDFGIGNVDRGFDCFNESYIKDYFKNSTSSNSINNL